MRAGREAHVKFAGERQLHRTAGRRKHTVGPRKRQVNHVTDLIEAQAARAGDAGLHFAGHIAGGLAVLERGESVAMRGGIDVNGIGGERLADHETPLAVRIATGQEVDLGGEGDVAGHFFPDEVMVVATGPHVEAGGAERVGALGGVMGEGARALQFADVGTTGEETERLGGADRCGSET